MDHILKTNNTLKKNHLERYKNAKKLKQSNCLLPLQQFETKVIFLQKAFGYFCL